MNWEVLQGDAIETMKGLPDGSIDACITDPPYGTTACSWDSVIPFAPMWAALKRVVKKNGAIALFGSQPFTSALVMSNPQMFKYELVWDKVQTGAPGVAYIRPLPCHENVLVFSSGVTTFNPQMSPGTPYVATTNNGGGRHGFGFQGKHYICVNEGVRFPLSIVRQEKERHPGHATQKPVELMRYLVRTYTNEGDTVLDFTCGSGSTGVACAIEKRGFIGIEQDPHYVEVSRARISRARGVAADIPRRTAIEKELPLFSAA